MTNKFQRIDIGIQQENCTDETKKLSFILR